MFDEFGETAAGLVGAFALEPLLKAAGLKICYVNFADYRPDIASYATLR